MRLQHITFTGIDAKTDISALREIQREFPLAEFGVLTSYHWDENGNRYLDPALMKSFAYPDINLSLHVCGSAAHDAAVGLWNKIKNLTQQNFHLFKRVQLNIAGRKDNPARLASTPNNHTELIVQQIPGNTSLFGYSAWLPGKVSMLLDESGGRGIDTPLEVWPSTSKIGYAGGFNPDNVGDKLAYLMENVRQGEFWIDMESGVRTDDWFDINKVEKVLNICYSVIKDFK